MGPAELTHAQTREQSTLVLPRLGSCESHKKVWLVSSPQCSQQASQNAERPERKEAPESCGILLRVVFGSLSVGHPPPTPSNQFSYWTPARTFTELKFLKVCFYLPSLLSNIIYGLSHSCSAAFDFFSCVSLLFSLLSHLHTQGVPPSFCLLVFLHYVWVVQAVPEFNAQHSRRQP